MGKKPEQVDLDTRRRIYLFIQRSPGIHERELSRRLNIPMSTMNYHLYQLKKRNLVSVQEDGRYLRYYPIGAITPTDKKVLSILRQRVTRKIILFLILHPYASHKKIVDHLGVAPSTTSFHLKKMLELEIIVRMEVGKETAYHVTDVETVCDLLIAYRRSFLDRAVDQFVETWLEVHPKNLSKKKKE